MRPMKPHLSLRIQENNETINNTPIDDPFHHTTIRPSGWRAAWLVLTGRFELRVKVCGDNVAHAIWFNRKHLCSRCQVVEIGFPKDGSNASDPGYHHGEERLCEYCYYEKPLPEEYRTTKVLGLSNAR